MMCMARWSANRAYTVVADRSVESVTCSLNSLFVAEGRAVETAIWDFHIAFSIRDTAPYSRYDETPGFGWCETDEYGRMVMMTMHRRI